MTAEEGKLDPLAGRALLAHVRHEIRTPINAILGYTEMLLEDDTVPGAAPDLQRILAAGRELLELVDRFLGSTQADTGLDWETLGAEIRHAMRTPIDTILGYCEILREDLEGEAPASFSGDLQRIEAAARRLLLLIEDLVRLARQGADSAMMGAAFPTGIKEALSDMVDAIQHRKALAPAPGQGGRLLVADDNSVDRELLVRRLQRAGYLVAEAENGRQALERIQAGVTDLVLLDVLMPELNGFQVLDQLKADPNLRPIPVIMLSSWDEADSIARCLAAGAEDYLPKPVNPVVLLARIESSLDRKRKWDLEVAHLRQLEEEKTHAYGDLIGKQAAMALARKQLDALVRTGGPVLIQGERGTGRELAGRLIHRQGPRKDGPLLSIDASAIADSPWGDKLLGESGAGEGGPSSGRVVTYLDLVEGGTLLLKNIEHLPLAVQERLARFLGPEPLLPGQRQPDVRVLATCGGGLTELTAAGQIHPALALALSGQLLTMPSLRDRKRDIPELAAYFLRRSAARLNKPVTGFEDSALTRLVTYDYPAANVLELEEAIERAVSLASRETIGAEEIFLGPPPQGPPGGFNLLRLPAVLVRLGLGLFPGPAKVVTAVVFALIIASCFLLPVRDGQHPGTLLVWSLWWPMLMVMFVFAGRIWCALCPMALAGEAAQRLAPSKAARRIPAWMKDHEVLIPMGGFFLIMWAEAVTGMRHSPFATGILLLAILAGAVVAGFLFPRRAWCRHLCPLGGFAGVCSTTALLELRPTPDICAAKCKGHDCYTGKEAAPGCPMFQHLMFVDSNQHCVLCMHCVRNCPNGSPRLNLRWPGRELWAGLDRHPTIGAFVLMLIGLLAAETLLRRMETTPDGLLVGMAGWPRAGVVTAVMVVFTGISLTVFGVANRLARDRGGAFWGRVLALAPFVTSGFLAFQLGFVPGFAHVRLAAGYHPEGSSGADWAAIPALVAAQALVLLAGLAITLLAFWRIGRTPAKAA